MTKPSPWLEPWRGFFFGNESHPNLFQPDGGFPERVKVDDGLITLPSSPGIGFEGKADLHAEMKASVQ